MNKIYEAFKNKKAFIPFITCGDPDVATTKATILEMVKNGADLIEIGIPFSDPTAEGVVIQGANIRALAGGITTDKVFDMVADVRKEVSVPLVFMFYLYHTQRVKKLENKIKRIEQKQKGNKEMSRLLKELIGKTPKIFGQVFGTDNWEVVDVDEEWVKLRRVDKKGKEKFKLQRIEDIQTVEFDGK